MSLMMFSHQDNAWALKRKVNGVEMACEDRCDACAALHQRAFSFISWEDFCDPSLEHIQSGKAEAKQLLNDPTGKRPWPLGVEGNISATFEISKDFIVASEADLRKWTKQTRIPKKLVQGIPTITVGAEEVFVFSDPHQVLRRGTLKISSDTVVKEHCLKQQDILWGGQAASLFDTKKHQQDGIQALLSPNVQLMTPEDFLHKRLGASSPPSIKQTSPSASALVLGQGLLGKDLSSDFAAASADDAIVDLGAGGQDAEDDEEDEPVLGPAAAAAAAAADSSGGFNPLSHLMASKARATQPPLAKNPSKRGKKGDIVHTSCENFSETASLFGGSVAGASTRSKGGTIPDESGRKGEHETWVDYWRNKGPIAAILSGEKDKRIVNGIGARIKDLKKLETIHPDLPGLENYHVVAIAANDLKEKSILGWDEAELQKAINLVEAEKCILPPDIQSKLVSRKCHHLQEQKEYKKLLDVCTPFWFHNMVIIIPKIVICSSHIQSEVCHLQDQHLLKDHAGAYQGGTAIC
eukprot:2934459-Amphidinium_carterae.3